MDVKNSEGIARMSPKHRRIFLPYYIVRLFTGATELPNYRGRKDVMGLRWCGEDYTLHIDDYTLAQKIATEIMDEWAVPESTVADFLSPSTILHVHDMAAKRIARNRTDDGRKKKNGICMLKEASGCGWWRMVHPSNYMNLDKWYIDITAAEVDFENLLDYDTIYVQRMHLWSQFYMLEKLKKAKKRIVYDLDDDIFCIPEHNPASKVIGRDEQFAALACIKLADVVTTTSQVLADRIGAELDENDRDKIRVIPNCLDPDDGWFPTEETGSPDGNLRIFWQGSKTHAEDWHECIEAIDTMMAEFPNLRLVILGFLPPVVQERANTPLYKGRIEFMGFSDPESYFQLIKHVRADVGLAPLQDTRFNQAKSPIKVIENALIGMATVASDCLPYNDMIDDGETGFLATTKGDWEVSLRSLLTDADRRKKMVGDVRYTISHKYDIKDAAKEWEQVLIG